MFSIWNKSDTVLEAYVLIFAAATDEISVCYGKPWIVKEIIPIFVGGQQLK